jgi:hypothetical protein
MPVLLTESAGSPRGTKPVELPLFDESGEPTLAGQVVADFLESADFSHVFEHPEMSPFIITVVDEDDESIEEQVLPGNVALRVIDENDLGTMFAHYLDALGENVLAAGEDAVLEDKAKLTLFENALLKPLNERFKRGAFRQMRKAEGGAKGRGSQVNMMLGAMLAKGEIKRAKSPGSGYKGGDYEKGSRYKSGATKAATQKGKQVARRMKAKNLRGKMSAGSKRAARRGRALAASVGMEESFLFGHGTPFNGAVFQVGTVAEAEIEFSEAEVGQLKKRFPCYEGLKTTPGRKGLRVVAEDAEVEGEGSDAGHGLRESLDESHGAPFAGAVGSPSLSESANIAAGVGRVMGWARKPASALDESAKK